MILLLPGNHKSNISLFDSIYSERKKLLENIEEVCWFKNSESEDNLPEENIENITHRIYNSSDKYLNYLTSQELICFADHLNIPLITFWENTASCSCFYFHHKDQTFKKVEQTNLFIRIFNAINPYNEMVVGNKIETESIENFKHIDFEKIFHPIWKELNSKKKFYSLFYKEKYFLNKFLSLYETKHKILIKRIPSEYLLSKSIVSSELKKSKIIFVKNFDNIDKSDQEYLIHHSKLLLKNANIILFECTDPNQVDFIKTLIPCFIELPDSSILFRTYTDLGILLFALKEVTLQQGKTLNIKSYARIYLEEFFKSLNFNKCSFSELIHSLQILLPDKDYTVDIMDYGFWYQLFLNMKSDNLGQEIDFKEYEMTFGNQDEFNETENVVTTNSSENTQDTESIAPNRIERKGKIVKIYFNNIDLDFIGSDYVGWKYLEFLITNSHNGVKYPPLDLYNIINNDKLSRSQGATNSTDKMSDSINDDHKAIEYIDKKTLVESLERLKLLEESENSFEIDDDQLRKIKKEKNDIQKFINNNSRLVADNRGKLIRVPKKTESSASKKERTIKQNIERVINPLKDHFPEAYEHFSLYLIKEAYFQYNPPKDFIWKY